MTNIINATVRTGVGAGLYNSNKAPTTQYSPPPPPKPELGAKILNTTAEDQAKQMRAAQLGPAQLLVPLLNVPSSSSYNAQLAGDQSLELNV